MVSARPAEAEARLGLAGVGDLLDDVLDHVRPELPVPQADALAVALLLERPAGAAPEDRTVAVAVLNALRLLAAERPLIVAVDDVQWLDAASAAVLALLGGGSGRSTSACSSRGGAKRPHRQPRRRTIRGRRGWKSGR